MADIPIGDLRVASADLLVETLLRLQKELRELRAERDHAVLCADAYKTEADQFRDAAKMVSAAPQPVGEVPQSKCGLTECAGKPMCARCQHQAGEVPIPEPDIFDQQAHIFAHSTDQLRTYGDAREAAGYAAGVAVSGKDADKLAHTLAMARSTFKKYADLHRAKGTSEGSDKAAANQRLVEICDAALRREVK